MKPALIALDHDATAYHTMPVEFGSKLAGLTEEKLIARFFQHWKETAEFLNELAPQGYRIRGISAQPMPKESSYRIIFRLWVCEADANRIILEWDASKGKEAD
jgi:hypothetical protein